MSAFITTNKTINNVVEAHRRIEANHGGSASSIEQLTALGQKLFNLNTVAVNGRYAEQTDAPEFALIPVNKASDAQLWSSIRCLNYQCLEEAGMKHPDYQDLKEIMEAFATMILNKVFENDPVEWDEA